MDQRLECVLQLLSKTASVTELCRQYGISRKTLYKWKQRFAAAGIPGLDDASRRPEHSPAALEEAVVCELVRLKQAYPAWGARKLQALYQRLHGAAATPSESSVKRVLEKAGLVEHRQPRRSQEAGRLQSRLVASAPNQLWTVDFKGWWHSSDHRRCEPLTVRDAYSRYLLCVRPLADACSDTVRRQFALLFERYGLPQAIRSDNGSPFASSNAPLGLSRLSAWWVALGIDLDRTDPGRPDQNGAHERMHRDLAAEVQYAQTGSLEELDQSLELWRQTYNHERPHEALGMKTPAEVYVPSQRKYQGDPERLEYPLGYLARQVTCKGEISLHGHGLLISAALAGWQVGLKPEDPDRYSVFFGRLCLGQVDLSTGAFHCPARTAERQAEPAAAKEVPPT